jgi:Domain of unknown function (DUF1911)
MRVRDPIGGVPDLSRFFDAYDRYFRELGRYEFHIKRVIAGYSRGDRADQLLKAFSFAVDKLTAADETVQVEYGADHHILAHRGRYPALLQAALVYLTFGLCLRAPRRDIEAILGSCDRGDPLLETLARAAAPGSQAPQVAAAFYDIFDALYTALNASEDEREICIQEYLRVWYRDKMDGFPLKDEHLLKNQTDYVGYWCFEAAGVVAALGIDDSGFADHPHYPRELVAFYRMGDRIAGE